MSNLTTVYLAPEGYEVPLHEELEGKGATVLWRRGRLFGASGPRIYAAWAQNVWLNPEFISIASIGEGIKALRSRQRNWALLPGALYRRASLIQQGLPAVARRPFVFGDPAPVSPMGGWTLWDANTILASGACTSPFPHGEIHFSENTTEPPSRAYLKLWELFTLTGRRPGPGDLCLDLGSAPGGWSWVLAASGARVFSVDKAPLAPHVERMPLVNHCSRSSAFGFDPAGAGKVDWIFCDVVCYPSRLLDLVTQWISYNACCNFVCTLKFQKETDHQTSLCFENIDKSSLIHLFHNKHELTWTYFAI